MAHKGAGLISQYTVAGVGAGENEVSQYVFIMTLVTIDSRLQSVHTFYFFVAFGASSPKYHARYIFDTPWGQKGTKKKTKD